VEVDLVDNEVIEGSRAAVSFSGMQPRKENNFFQKMGQA
jgi:hypothetical protein